MQAAEAADEERRRRRQDVVVGLEPRDEALGPLALDPAEPQEGVHLVQVAGDGLGHPLQAVDQGIARHLQQATLAVENAPDQGVEESVAFGVAMRHHFCDEVADPAR
ncbi:hypothetical protein PMNALOAF_4225 [Methylobacterium adhaesivum]|nr:hypothetical protein PMNALOAF_4225 [Methylobacterium adhaesivum]